MLISLQTWRLNVIVLMALLMSACASNETAPITEQSAKPSVTTQANTTNMAEPLPHSVLAAKRFMSNAGAGNLAMFALQKEMNKLSVEQPGLAELTRRAFADVKQEDLDLFLAKIYARHMSFEDLNKLAESSEKDSIKRFFHYIFDSLKQEQKFSKADFTKQFNADELTEIIKFSQTDSFRTFTEVSSQIKEEIRTSSYALGQKLLQDYIDKQQ